MAPCKAKSDPLCARAPMPPNQATPKRTLAAGDGWSVHEIVCRAGPSDRPFEERHDGFSVSAVLDGSFTYRSDGGRQLLYPGALLLGNNGSCFECGHEHGVGDRCVSLNVQRRPVQRGRGRRGVFQPISLFGGEPAGFAEGLPIIADMEALSCAPPSLRARGAGVADRRTRRRRDDRRSTTCGRAQSGREISRVIEAIRLVESDATRPLELKEMAAVASMSKYHFLRVFSRLTGMTPHRHPFSARLRRAALALTSSRRPVIDDRARQLASATSPLSTRPSAPCSAVTPTQYRASRR